ncbi:hypothetical protein FOA52_005658, partial [Chlamydomonas sp. UWO 241]
MRGMQQPRVGALADLLAGLHHVREASSSQGRALRMDTSSTAFTWMVICFSAIGAMLLLGIATLICWYCCIHRRRPKVSPLDPNKETWQRGHYDFPQVNEAEHGPGAGGAAGEPRVEAGQHAGAPVPVPTPPANLGPPVPLPSPMVIRLADPVPTNFMPYVSHARPLGAPPYERLLLVSSRVHQPMVLASAALPTVAVVVYDWSTFTLQEIVRYIKRAVGVSKVTSVGVIAPGSFPGSVSVLALHETTPGALRQKGDLLQFWRVIAG